MHLELLFLGSGTSASLQQGRRGHKIINDPYVITIWMKPCRFRPCFSTVQFPIQAPWITALLNFELVPQPGVEGISHRTIKTTQCSYLWNNICVMFSSQNLHLLKNLSSPWSSFLASLAFKSFALSLNNHLSFLFPVSCSELYFASCPNQTHLSSPSSTSSWVTQVPS